MESEPEQQTRGPFGARTIRLGRILGIKVGLDPSWFIIFALVTVSLGSHYEEEHESWSLALSWGAGLAASLLYFLSILAHEFGHSLTSRLLGLPVISITLFLFGGLAQLSGEPRRPRDAFLIAIAGPMVSVILGGTFLILWQVAGDGTAVGEVSFWLGTMNLVLAVFNMIPGFPLDGGHVFRAVLWAVFDDLHRATMWAGTIGALFARLLIAGGFALVIFGGAGSLGSGLLMAFVGWFLLRAARGSVWHSRVKHYLEGVNVGEAMGRLEHRIDSWSTVEDVAEGPFASEGFDFVFIEDEGELRGVVSVSDVRDIPAEKRAFHRVTDVMTPITDVATIGPRETLFAALEAMQKASSDRLLVLHEGAIIGALSRDQLSSILKNRMSLKS
jgi:Zn-dependent protease